MLAKSKNQALGWYRAAKPRQAAANSPQEAVTVAFRIAYAVRDQVERALDRESSRDRVQQALADSDSRYRWQCPQK
jgi:hypothetical protein